MPTAPHKKAPASKKAASAKKAGVAEDQPAHAKGPRVGQLVECTFEDVPTASTVTTTGVVVNVDADGVHVAPLSTAAVFPPDQVRTL